MQIPIVVEPTADGQFRAHAPLLLNSVAEGPTSDVAVTKLREELDKELQNGKHLVMMEIPGGQAQPHPWLAMAGWLKDDPLVDEWRTVMREHRDQVNRDEGIERD